MSGVFYVKISAQATCFSLVSDDICLFRGEFWEHIDLQLLQYALENVFSDLKSMKMYLETFYYENVSPQCVLTCIF